MLPKAEVRSNWRWIRRIPTTQFFGIVYVIVLYLSRIFLPLYLGVRGGGIRIISLGGTLVSIRKLKKIPSPFESVSQSRKGAVIPAKAGIQFLILFILF